MEPQLPTSFIPKRPITSEPAPAAHSRGVGILSLVTSIIVVATIVSFGAVYLYQKSLATQKQKLQQSIEDAKNSIGTDFLSDMKRLTARISGVKTLVQNHVVVSPIFAALEATTLRSVQYKDFTYDFTTDANTKTQMVKVILNGNARNYSTIALQSDAFAQSTLIKNPVFSNLTIDDKTGTVNFNLKFDVAPEDLSFQSFIDAKMKASGEATVPSTDQSPPPASSTTPPVTPTNP